jgi:hypothetical protein
MRTNLSSQSIVEAMVTVAVALLLTYAGFEMMADVVANPATVQAAAGGQQGA